MNEKLAKAISWIFHPAWMPLYAFLIILYCFPFHYQYIPEKMYNISIITIFIMTILTPAILMLMLKKLDIVSDIDVNDSRQRIFPYLIYLFFYLMAYLIVKPREESSIIFMQDPLIASVLLGATIGLGVAFFANNFIKVSVHTMGASMIFAFTCCLANYTNKPVFFLSLLALLVVGLVGSSRIFLRAHTKQEVYLGGLIGFVSTLIGFYIYF